MHDKTFIIGGTLFRLKDTYNIVASNEAGYINF
jgi:hypothetical protein